jgi:P4 family phage/plasmid primase-like protien
MTDSTPDSSEVRREETEEGIFFVNGTKRSGPWTEKQVGQIKFEDRVAEELQVDPKQILAIDIRLRPRKIVLTDDTKAPEIAELIVRGYDILTYRDTGEILVYNVEKGLWELGGETFLANMIESEAHKLGIDRIITIHVMREVLERIRRRTYASRKEFDANHYILNLQNGLLDVRTRKLRPHTPDHKSVVQLPIKYDSEADCPKIIQFLRQVLYAEDLPCLQEYCGYTLWKDFPNAKMLMLYGVGANGKSTFISLLMTLLGIENIAARSLQDLATNRFAIADLYGKMANLYADLEDRALRYTALLKMLTGRDPIQAEHKFKPPFKFVNYAKPIFSANKIPEVFEDTVAFWRRWIIIQFPRIFEGNKENRNLLEELTTPEELSGFLNFALVGLARLRANGWAFSNAKSTEEVRQEYIRRSSPVQAFVLDCTEPETGSAIPKAILYETFKDYCILHKLPLIRHDSFFKAPIDHARVRTEHLRIGEKGKQVWCTVGLKIRGKDDWGKPQDGQQTLDPSLSKENGVPPVPPVSESGMVQPVQPRQPNSNFSNKVTEELIQEAVSLLREKLPVLCLESHSEIRRYLAERYGDAAATVILECLESRIVANPEGFLELT